MQSLPCESLGNGEVDLSQNEPVIEMYHKQDETTWTYTVSKGLDKSVRLRTIDHEIRLTDIYQKVVW